MKLTKAEIFCIVLGLAVLAVVVVYEILILS